MLDGFVLQVVLMMLITIATAISIVWFVCGITKKSAVWIVALFVPLVVIGAAVFVIIAM